MNMRKIVLLLLTTVLTCASWTARTQCAPGIQTVPLNFECHDSYGDGWNGCSLVVHQSGVALDTITLLAGNYGEFTVDVCLNGDSVYITWISGSWEGEVSFIVRDGGYNVLFSGNGLEHQNSDTLFTWFPTEVSCYRPTSLTVSLVTDTSVILVWDDPYNSSATYELALTPEGAIVPQHQASGLIGNSTVVSGLIPNTNYYVTLRACCSATDCSSERTTSFHTLCNTFMQLPFVETWDLPSWYNPWDNCWSGQTNNQSVSGDPYMVMVSTDGHNGYGNSIELLGFNDTVMLISVPVQLTGQSIDVSFWLRQFGGWLKAGVMTDLSNPSSFVPLLEINQVDYIWHEYSFSTIGLDSTATYYLVWKGGCDDYTSFAAFAQIDDIFAAPHSDCMRPQQAWVGQTDYYSAELSWTAVGGANGYMVRYGNSRILTDSIVVTDTTVTLTGLLPGSEYYATVSTLCGNQTSLPRWFSSFSTTISCASLTNVIVEDVTPVAARISWQYASELGFPSSEVMVKVFNEYDPNVPQNYYYYTGNRLLLTGLEPGTSYQVQLSNICPTIGNRIDTSQMMFVWIYTPGSNADTCYAPMVELTGAGTYTPSLHWPQFGTESIFVPRYRLAGSTNYTYLPAVTDTSYTFTLPQSGAYYSLSIGSVCSVDTLWSREIDVTTPCSGITIPWLVNFDDVPYGSLPSCWTVLESVSTYPQAVYAANRNGSDHSLAFNGFGTLMAVTEAIPLAGDSIEVEFTAYRSLNGPFQVGFISDLTDTSTFIPLVEITDWSWRTYHLYSSQLDPATSYHLAVYYHSDESWGTGYIDDIHIRADRGCRFPEYYSLWADSTHATSQWMTSVPATEYILRYQRESDTVWHLLTATPDTNGIVEYHLSGLQPASPYSIQCGALCGQDTLWNGTGFWTSYTCPRMTDVWVADSTTTSITFAWHRLPEYTDGFQIHFGDNYWYIYDTTFTFTDLVDNHLYTFDVSAYCPNYGVYSEPVIITAHTAAGPTITQYPYCTSFDNEADNQDWILRNDQTNRWYFGTATGSDDNHSLYITTGSSLENTYNIYSYSFSYAIRQFAVTEGDLFVSFKWHAYGESSYDYIRAWIAPQDASPMPGQTPNGGTSSYNYTTTTPEGWIDLGGKMNNNSEWTSVYAPVHLDSGTYRLIFMWANDGSAGTQPPAAIDNLCIKYYTCPAVASVNTQTIGIHNTILKWSDTLGGDGITYAIVDANENVVGTTTDTTFNITGLNASTQYTYGVVRQCSANNTSYPAYVTFTTHCEMVTLPYTNDFENEETSNIPQCWQRKSATSYYPYVSSSNGFQSSRCLYFYCSSSSEDSMMAILPEIDLQGQSMTGHQLVFIARKSNYNPLTVQVGTMSDPDNPATFVADSILDLTDASEMEYMIPLAVHSPATNTHIAIMVQHPENYNYLYLDNVMVDVIPTCLRPVGLNIWGSFADSLTIYWEAGTADSWEIEASDNDTTLFFAAAPPAVTFDNENRAFYTIKPLQPYTNYYVRMRAVCGNEHSYWPLYPAYMNTLNNESNITSFVLTNLEREDAVIDTAAHTVTIPIYYSDNLTDEEGSYTLSDGAWMQVLDDAGVWNNVNELRDILRHAWQNVPLLLRVYAQDSKYHTDWTLLFVGEACSRVSQLKFHPERTALNLTWEETDPSAGSFQLVVSPTTLSSDALEVAQKTIVSQKSYRIEGLERNTTYYIYLRADCDYCLSGWTMLEARTLDLIECSDVTIGDSLSTSTSYHTPLNNFYNYTLTETILDEEELEDIVSIEGISYYYDYSEAATVKDDVTIWLQPTSKSSFASGSDVEPLDTLRAVQVYHGPMNLPQGWNSIVFDVPYVYEGGNLLVIVDDNSGHYNGSSYVFRTSPTEEYMTLEWYSDGYNPDPTNLGAFSGSKAYYRYRALMYVYGCTQSEACPTVDTVTVDNIGTTEATVHWTPSEADYLNHYEVFVSPIPVTDPDSWNGGYVYSGTALSCPLTGLSAYTDYWVYVRANCVNSDRDEGVSTWQSAQFKTFSECRTVADLTARVSGKHEAVVSWRNQSTTANYEYVLSTTELTDSQMETATLTATGINDTMVVLTGLANGQTYWFYIRNNCGGDVSPWMVTSLTTWESMPAVIELRAEGVSYNALTAVWERNEERFADETAWRVAVTLDSVVPTEWSTVYAMSHVFYGLTADTMYRVFVAAYDTVSDATSDTVSIAVRTLGLPTDCVTVAEGSSSNSYVPLYGGYTDNHQRSQSVYPAELLVPVLGKTLTGMSYSVVSGSSSGWNTAQWEVSVGVTPAADVAAGWADTAVLTRVYTGTLSASPEEGMSVVFDHPFVYTGGNLLVQFVERVGHPTYSSCSFRGSSVAGASRYAYPSNSIDLMSAEGTVQNFLPQVQFCFEHVSDCYAVSRVFFENTTAHTTDVLWYMGSNESEWEWKLKVAGGQSTVDSGVATVNELSLTGLLAETEYHIALRPHCSANTYGDWSWFSFTTLPSCGLPDTLWAEAGGWSSVAGSQWAVLHAEGVTLGSPEGYTFRWWPLWGGDTLSTTVSADSVVVTGLMGNTDYGFDVQVHCGTVDGDSRWTLPAVFHTPCGPVGLPYYHHFSWDNSCWTLVSDNGANSVTVGSYCNGQGVRFSSASTLRSGTYNQYAFSPELDNPAASVQKVVIEYATEGSNNRLWIGYTTVEGSTDPEDYTWSNTYFTSSSECDLRWAQLLLPSGTKRMAVRYYGTHAGKAYLYSVNISEPATYTLEVNVDTTMGTYEGPSGMLYEGTDVTLQVNPKHGYRFYNWSYQWGGVMSQENPYHFTLNESMYVVANFIINKYNVTAVSSNTTMGTVTGGGRVDYLTPLTLSATANYGYHFTHWSNGDSLPTITLTADSNITLVAYFDYNRYAIVGTAADAARGHVEGSDTVNFLTEVTLTAVPEYGYHFVGWSNGDTSTSLTITAVENRSLTANFAPNPYSVTGLAADVAMGSVSGSATVDYLSPVTLTASANYGYHFVGWSNGASTPSITVVATRDTTLTALFDYNSYTVTATSGDTVMGTVSGSATVNYLDSITLVATPHYGYHFTSWSNGATGDTLRLQVTADLYLMANFTYNQYTVSGITATPGRGSVIGSATVNYLSPVSLNATPYYGYRFTGWTGDIDSADAFAMPITVIADRNRTVVATFDTIVYNVTASINHAEMGTVSGADSTRHFATAHLTATANYGYHFVNWTNTAGNVLGVGSSLNISPVSDTAVIANFDYNQYTVSGTAADATMGTVSGSATANYLDSVTLTALAGVCYHFTGWSNGDTATSITIPVLHDSAVVAYFAVNVYGGSQQENTCDSYTWNGQPYNQSGVYQQLLATANGCDSTATLNLTLRYSTSSSQVETVCDSFLWRDSLYTLSGQYTFDTINAVGCDSTAALVLTVNYSTETTLDTVADISFLWEDSLYTESTVIVSHHSTTAGCDSTVTCNLTIIPWYTVTLIADSTMGTVSGDGFYAEGSEVLLSALPLEHRHFTAWSDGVTDNPRTISVDSNIMLTAFFDYDSVELLLAVNDTAMGALDPLPDSYIVHVGDTVILTATPKEGYHFVAWVIEGDTAALADSVLTFIVTPDRAGTAVDIEAVFDVNVGIRPVKEPDVNIHVAEGRIVVDGLRNQDLYIYDVTGRLLHRRSRVSGKTEFSVTNSGVYLVKVGNAAAKRVAVVR